VADAGICRPKTLEYWPRAVCFYKHGAVRKRWRKKARVPGPYYLFLITSNILSLSLDQQRASKTVSRLFCSYVHLATLSIASKQGYFLCIIIVSKFGAATGAAAALS
jgi:hypothetical protein